MVDIPLYTNQQMFFIVFVDASLVTRSHPSTVITGRLSSVTVYFPPLSSPTLFSFFSPTSEGRSEFLSKFVP